ncbi:unnamed protein product [Brassicogethes aeneus]|uniref:Endonuclease/exonuclease/phosphatase domain-containing protein n=1 Tax=Brassicogethes aeneus TaxID=1431903 RepID=A0A9P0BB05_BRAAE|nr:unnamed protein product [Brassicogethes aeneus]
MQPMKHPAQIARLLRYAQINLNHSRLATRELLALITQERLDAILVQEPYCIRTTDNRYKIPGLGQHIKQAHVNTQTRPLASVILINRARDALFLPQYSSPNVSTIKFAKQINAMDPTP